MGQVVRFAIVGTGRVGISHVRGILNSPGQLELAGIVDQNRELADQVAGQFNTKAFYSLEEALADESIDVFIVALPQYLHYPLGLQILNAKRHALIEKPLGLDLKEVGGLIQAAERNGVYVMSAQSRRFYLALQEAKTMLPRINGPTNMLYNFACIFTEKTAPPWWREESKSGGLVLGMLGSHSIDTTLWMNEGKNPVRVFAQSRKITNVFEGDDACTVIIAFDDGTMATNYLSICNSPYRHDCLIEGRRGSVYFRHEGDHVGVIGVSDTQVFLNGEEVEVAQEPDCFTLQARELASAIVERRQPVTSGQNVWNTYLVLEAAKESAKTHSSIVLEDFKAKYMAFNTK